jgi:protein TonB
VHASRALVGSVIVNAALLALLLAIAPRRYDTPPAPTLVDVAIAPVLPSPSPAPSPSPSQPVVAPAIVAPHRARAAAPALPAPTTTSSAVDDLAADSGSGAGGNGDGTGSGTVATAVAAAPPGPAATRPIPIGAHDAQLPYTRDALVAHAQGLVLVGVLVGVDGKVHETTLVRGLGHGLDQIALALAEKLQFQPARDALGAPTAARIIWRFHFTPPRDAL